MYRVQTLSTVFSTYTYGNQFQSIHLNNYSRSSSHNGRHSDMEDHKLIREKTNKQQQQQQAQEKEHNTTYALFSVCIH